MAKPPEIFIVKASKDRLKAYLTVRSSALRVKLTISRLKTVLESKGIKYGIKEEILEKLTQIYMTREEFSNIVVAEGIVPVAGETPSVELTFKETAPSPEPEVNKLGRMDYRERSQIHNVRKNQILAIVRWKKPPVIGITVTGRKVAPPIQDIEIVAGENVIQSFRGTELLFKAGADGALQFEDNTLKVTTKLSIDKDVNFEVGNIRFNGDVDVGRDVMADFLVEAAGNIYIWGTAVACRLSSGKNLEVRTGIIGKGRGTVECGGNITVGYVEKATLSAKENITIKSRVIMSRLMCDGYIKTQVEGSRISNSQLKAAAGIECWDVGGRTDRQTQLITGLNPAYEKEFTRIRETMETKTKEAKFIERRYGIEALSSKHFNIDLSPAMRVETQKWDILRDEITESKKILSQYEHLVYNHDAIIIVKGTIYPGVLLKIGKYQLTTDEIYKNIEVKVSKEGEKLVILR